jgi:hypothetical protein
MAEPAAAAAAPAAAAPAAPAKAPAAAAGAPAAAAPAAGAAAAKPAAAGAAGAKPAAKEEAKAHPYRAHAWTEEQYPHQHETAWVKESEKPTGYLDKIPLNRALAQRPFFSMAQAEPAAAAAPAKTEAAAPAKTEAAAPAKKEEEKKEEAKKEEPKKEEAKKEDAKKEDAKKEDKKEDAKKGEEKKEELKKDEYGNVIHEKSYLKPYNHKEHAWTPDAHDKSHPKEFEEETKKPSGYQDALGAGKTLAQHPGETKSTVTDYRHKDHTWSEGQLPFINPKEWEAETVKPTLVLPSPHNENVQIVSDLQHHGETNSILEPYDQREHAWSFDQLYTSNPISWHHETLEPSGYQVTPDTPESLL